MPTTRRKAKTTAKTSAKKPKRTATVAKVPQPHGGALNAGGTPGNKGGPGRPPSILREQLRGSYGDRMTFLDRVIDGEALQRVEVPLASVLPHVTCANCGESQIAPTNPENLLLVTIDGKVSATVKDRIAALEHQAKYGLGALKEVSVENVRERVASTLAVIRAHCSPEQATQIITALRPVWA